MTVIDKIIKSKSPLFTFELLPPLKGHNISEIFNVIDNLIEFNPAYINITYHQKEVVMKKRSDGLMEKVVVRKRPGTVAIAAAIKNKYKVSVVPHLICGGFTKDAIEDALIDFQFLGINDLLVLRGDPPKGSRIFIPEEGGHSNTSELVEQIVNFNKGEFISGKQKNEMKDDFCVGVAGYPEKHMEAPNIIADLEYLKLKVDKGAQYIVTQMFFDNEKYFNFVKMCRDIGINVPIIPGVKPISSLNDINLLPQIFNIDLPNDLVSEINKCSTKTQIRQVGVEWTIKQSKELIKFGVPGIHYYSLGQSDNIKKIAKAIF
ncbi:MAG: methylenetetrahydrofolate reductase [NAD(P)H] [Bacteroidales bacterium]|jgi:methylenetetrahydrofolate reductase (NADPH)|nr:methylenetetrahydrofolate reductase [NAD(P)H] [Bacteroidales bacterium]